MKKIFIFLLALLFISCVSSIKHKVEYNIENLHKTVYIDRNFTNVQEYDIINALKAWECSTNGMIQFDIILRIIPEQIENKRNSLMFVKVNSQDIRILESDKNLPDEDKPKYTTFGLYLANEKIPTILLVDVKNVEPTAMHEIGHAVGLSHLDEKNSIMYAHINESSKCITKYDLIAFCKIYHCKQEEFESCS